MKTFPEIKNAADGEKPAAPEDRKTKGTPPAYNGAPRSSSVSEGVAAP